MKITKRSVEALTRPLTPDQGDVFAWDTDMPGFGVRVKPSGVCSYIVQYSNRQGRSRRITLGRHGVLTPDEARKLARQHLASVDKGSDPATEAQAARSAATIGSLCDRYLREYATAHKKPRSAAEDRRLLERQIRPVLGAHKVEAITRADMAKLHHALRETPYEANRTVALLSKMFNLAEVWGLRPDASNPCRHVQKYRETKRERFLSAEEVTRLGDTLRAMQAEGRLHSTLAAAFRLLLYTGCRLSEVCAFEWAQLDLAGARVRLPDSKTGAKTIQLGAPALAILADLPRGSRYVLPALTRPGEPVSSHTIEHVWRRVRDAARLPDVRLHDLRHTYASWAVMGGASLPLTGALLGHSQPQTTQRYAHFANDPLRVAADDISRRLAGAMEPGSTPAA